MAQYKGNKMYKINLKISEKAMNEIRSQVITAGICGRPPSASEQAIVFIIKAIEENKTTVTIELKSDLKKKKRRTKKNLQKETK